MRPFPPALKMLDANEKGGEIKPYEKQSTIDLLISVSFRESGAQLHDI